MDQYRFKPRQEDASNGGRQSDFPTTSWTDIDDVRDPLGTQHRNSLAKLYQQYREPLYILSIRSLRLSPNDSIELVQDFFVSKVIEKNIIARADQSRGRFRAFLSEAFVNFVRDHWRVQKAESKKIQRLASLLKSTCPSEVPNSMVVEWCRALVQHALDQLQSECSETGRTSTWMAFRIWFVNPLMHGIERPSIQKLTRELGMENSRQSYNKIETGKRAFARHLRRLVSLYTEEADIDAEISELMDALATSSSQTSPK